MALVDVTQAAGLLRRQDRVLILCHMKPDGDTLGAGTALFKALSDMGKQVRIFCSDGFPDRYAFMWEGLDLENQPDFEPDFIVAADIADTRLLGKAAMRWAEKVDLCIDHHPSNKLYAAHVLLEPDAAATAQIMYKVIRELTPLTPEIAIALYTGLATDTGCFRYSNTTAETLRAAADMVETGIDSAMVNKLMFETKTPGRIALEQRVMQTLEYYRDGKLAVMVVPKSAVQESGVLESDLEGLSSLPRQIEGVEVAVMLKESEPGKYRASLRTGMCCSATDVCVKFGGGGHARAAGCFLEMPLEEAKKAIVSACLEEMDHSAQG